MIVLPFDDLDGDAVPSFLHRPDRTFSDFALLDTRRFAALRRPSHRQDANGWFLEQRCDDTFPQFEMILHGVTASLIKRTASRRE